MSRPAWQKFTGSALAARMGDVPESDIAAALITRYMVALRPDVGVEMNAATMETYPSFAASVAANDFPLYAGAMRNLLIEVGAVGIRETDTWAVGKAGREARALWQLARVAYLRLPSQEIEAALALAEQIKTVDRKGTTPGAWEIGTSGGWTESTPWTEQDPDSGWSGFRGFGSLRSEIEATGAPGIAAVLSAFDALARSATQRRAYVRGWQTWANSRGLYTGTIDGIWGPKSEAAFTSLLPRAYGRPTTLADLLAINFGGIDYQALLSVGISRDNWLATRPTLPPRPTPAEPEVVEEAQAATTGPTRIDITLPPTTTGEEETVIVTPVTDPAGGGVPIATNPQRVEITLPSGETQMVLITPVEEPSTRKINWVGWGAVALAVAGVVVAVVVGKKKPAYEEK